MRNKDRRRGKIKDCGNNRVCECKCVCVGRADRLKVSAPHFTTDGDFTPGAPYLRFSHLGLARSNSLAAPSRLLCKQTGTSNESDDTSQRHKMNPSATESVIP